MRKLFVCLTAILLAVILSCAAYADIAPLPDDWDYWGTPVEPSEEETDTETPDAEESETVGEIPADPESPDPGLNATQTGCSRFSVPLFVLCGGIVFIAAGILCFVIGRRGRGAGAE